MLQISPHKITNTFSLSRATRASGGGARKTFPPHPLSCYPAQSTARTRA